MSGMWDEWGNPLDDEAEAIDDKNYTISALTCPYYWDGRIDGGVCARGCWEEPSCHTDGPFEFPPDWPAERCLSAAVNVHVNYQFNRPNPLWDRLTGEA